MPVEHFLTDRNPAFRLTDTVTARAMQIGSTLRSVRIFHPEGIAQRVTVTVRPTDEDPDATALGVPLRARPGPYAGVVRFPRGASLPEPLPDVLGLAIRIVDAHGPG